MNGMEYFEEPARKIPVTGDCDVLVLGAGPAGFGAALCAARQGADTILAEQSGEVGGVATSGLMSHWTGSTKGGLFEELIARSTKSYVPRDLDYFPLINHEYLKDVMLSMLAEAGAKLRLYTFASGAVKEGNTLRGAVTESKSGREMIRAKVTVDCTGDGDIAARAGAAFEKGRAEDGGMQPMTLMLQLAGVDRSRVHYITEFGMTWNIGGRDIQEMARAALPFPAGHVLIYPTVFPGSVILNMTNCIDVDGTCAADLTKAHLLCRSQIGPILRFLQEQVPGFENAYPIKTSSRIGVRETRRFRGVETITEEDILAARVFSDWAVTKAHFNFDVHNVSGSGLDKTGCQLDFSQPKGYTIPYGCFVPETIDGLLIAGRCISGTHMAHSNYRAMPICLNMGQAAGTAAALCARQNIQPRALDVGLLQSCLRKQNVSPD
jgi:glycine/D-amino acid oxidase-like deaminating enzyme